jgi:hypothetical protein
MPTRPELTGVQVELVRRLAGEAGAWAGGLNVGRHPTVLATLARDRFGVVTDAIRTALWQGDRFDLMDYGIGEKLRKQTAWTRAPVETLEEAVASARSREARLVVWGRVQELSDFGGAARLAGNLLVADATTGQVLARRDFDLRPGEAAAGESLPLIAGNVRPEGGWPWMNRLFAWAVATLLLPLAAYPASARVMAAESNAATLALLLAHVLVSTVAAYALLFRSSQGFIAGTVFLAVAALTVLYHWNALVTIKRLCRG